MRSKIENSDLDSIFSSGGPVSEILPGFEQRKEQSRMSEFIYESLEKQENGIVEAGTGVGKTLAYLIPAVRFALAAGKRVAISTETKALQKQLISKDMPLIEKLFSGESEIPFKYSVCYGGGNYPCRKRFEMVLSRGQFADSDLSAISALNEKFEKGEIFTRLDVRLPARIWVEIQREGDACDSFKCFHAQTCPFQKARKEWAESSLLIMNHYLFFTNIASNKVYLPESDIVIFDEAHAIEDIACSQIGFDLSYSLLVEILSLFKSDTRKRSLLGSMQSHSLVKSAGSLIKKITTSASEFFEGLREYLKDGIHFRLKEPLSGGAELVEHLKNLMILVSDMETEFSDENPLKMEFDIARGKLFGYVESFKIFYYQNLDDYVYWIEKEPGEILGDIHLRAQPVDVSEIMAREVFDYYESCFLVSATLSVAGDFSFIAGRLGLDGYRSISIPPAFDYKKHMVIYAGKNIPEPSSSSFLDEAASVSAEIIRILNGNCLMLFTSYRMLSDIKERLESDIDHTIYSQEDFPSAEALELFVNDENSVLMGTHSFWQGIDLKGDLLRGVIMMRLPFTVPDSPPFKAKVEKIESAGGNPFNDYQIPEAVIKFRQGFGRLIRSSTDYGIVAILDSRIINKPYGRKFLKSLPECRVVFDLDDLDEIYQEMSSR